MLLFCAKTILRVTQYLTCPYEERELILALWGFSGLRLLQCLFAPLGDLMVMKYLKMNGMLL